MKKIKVKMYDEYGYLIQQVVLSGDDALPQVIIWGEHTYAKFSKRTYRRVTHKVITDTSKFRTGS